MSPNTHSTQDLTEVLAKIDQLPGVSTGDRVLLEIAAILAHCLPPIIDDLLSTIPPTLPTVQPEFRGKNQ
jgi:hypothetical protein